MNHAVITGANRGIGLELGRQLRDRGWAVTATCRKASPALRELGVQVLEGIDVSDEASVKKLAAALEPASVSLLVNNAGLLESTSLDHLDLDAIRRQFEVNALGPLRVTHALLPAMQAGGKVALITSRMGSIGDNSSGGGYGYRMSKAALNAAGKSLALDLAGRDISVAILHPGYVRTDMTGHGGLIDVEESASGLLERIDGLTAANSGTFWHCNGEVLPW
jgi:NAD(P)-dependent dehydrogenase (short-subunit alcohol dehydrogenase family)